MSLLSEFKSTRKKSARGEWNSRELRPVRFSERKTRLKTRRRRARFFVGSAVLIVIAGLVWGVSTLTHLSVLQITHVDVVGAEQVSASTIQNEVGTILHDGAFHLFSRTNMFLYPKKQIVESVMNEFPRIASVQVSRNSLFAQAVSVVVSERMADALWCDVSCFAMDEKGYVFAEAASSTEGYHYSGGLLPEVTPIGQTFLRGTLPEVRTLLDALLEQGFTPLGARVDNEKDYTVHLSHGPDLFVSFGLDPEAVLNNLKTVISSDALNGSLSGISYIDLRYGERVYYKMKSGAGNAPPTQ